MTAVTVDLAEEKDTSGMVSRLTSAPDTTATGAYRRLYRRSAIAAQAQCPTTDNRGLLADS